MALSNPLHGERRPGAVGLPLPGVEVALADERGGVIAEDDVPGEIVVRGPTVFREYWRRPDATRDVFRDGWFRTGDVALVERRYYRILGRSSVDIIKTGGFKVSALEIEEALRAHPAVADCAVVGVDDPEWGERVGAAVVPRAPSLSPDALREWLGERLAPYKVPRLWTFVDELPRNAMGKVTKPAVREFFAGSQQPAAKSS
jgi:malonyl-CoA/methylmalonyl-CoA synthetase